MLNRTSQICYVYNGFCQFCGHWYNKSYSPCILLIGQHYSNEVKLWEMSAVVHIQNSTFGFTLSGPFDTQMEWECTGLPEPNQILWLVLAYRAT